MSDYRRFMEVFSALTLPSKIMVLGYMLSTKFSTYHLVTGAIWTVDFLIFWRIISASLLQ